MGYDRGRRVRGCLPFLAPGRLGRRTHTFEERLRQDRPCYPRRRTEPLTLAPHTLRQGSRGLEVRWLLITSLLRRDFQPGRLPLLWGLGQRRLPLYLRRTPTQRWHLAAFSHTAGPPGGASPCAFLRYSGAHSELGFNLNH